MADPMEVLAPNTLGTDMENRGVDELIQNRGLGVPELGANQQAQMQRGQPSNPKRDEHMHKLRVGKAREFGMPQERVGF